MPKLSDLVSQGTVKLSSLQGVQDSSTPDQMPVQPSFGDQLGRSFLRAGKAIGEGVTGTLDFLATPFRAGINAIAPDGYKAGTATGLLDQGLQAAAPNTDLSPQGAAERYADAIGRGVGGAASGIGVGGLLSGAASPVVSGIGRTLASNPWQQVGAATTGSTSSQVAQDLGANPLGQFVAGLGGAMVPGSIGALGNGAQNALGWMFRPSAEQQALAQGALQRNIPLKASQVSGGPFSKYLDSVTSIVPGSGAKGFDEAQRTAFNQAVGKTIGADPAATKLTDQVFSKAKTDTSDIYNDLWNRNDLQLGQGLIGRFQQAIDNAVSADPSITSKINGYWQRIAKGSVQDPNGGIVLPGSRFKEIDSDMGRDAMKGGDEGRYIGDIQDALREAMGQGMSQQDQSLLQQANQQWGAIKTLAPLVAKSPSGDISPTALQSAVTNNAASKMAMATGNRGELGTLARIGQGLLKEPPQSGTEPRMMVRNFLTRVGSLGGVLAGGNVLGGLGTVATGAGILGGSRIAQGLLQSPGVVARAAGVPLAAPNYLNGIPWAAAQSQAYPLLQQPGPMSLPR